MKNYLIYILVIALYGYHHTLAQDALQKKQSEILTKLKEALPKNAEISIGIVNDDSIQYLGFRKVKTELVEIENQNSVFEIGSITKVFTSVLLAHAVKEMLIQINDPISGSTSIKLKQPERNNKHITYETLANHTSGLPRMPSNLKRRLILHRIIKTFLWPFIKTSENPYYGYNYKKFNRYLKRELKPKTTPSEEFRYSNLGAGLLGYLLENKYNLDYETLLQQKILIPYQMSSTTTKRELISERLIIGRNRNGNKVKNWDLISLKAAGAMLSSVSDLVKFASANFKEDSILAFTRKKTFSNSTKNDIGLGWLMTKLEDGTLIYWHNGGTGGYSASMSINTENRQAVIILSNVGDKNETIDIACFELIKEINIGQ